MLAHSHEDIKEPHRELKQCTAANGTLMQGKQDRGASGAEVGKTGVQGEGETWRPEQTQSMYNKMGK